MTPSSANIEDLIDISDVTGADVLVAIGLLIIGLILGRVTRRAMMTRIPFFDGVPDRVAVIVAKTTGYTVTFVFVVYALSFLGVDTGPIFILMLFVLVVAFFSLKPLLENLAAGLLLQTSAPFEPGDVVTVAGLTGILTTVDTRTTVITTPEGDEVRIPNTHVLGGTIVNLSKLGVRRSSVLVGVAYGTDVTEARAVIELAVARLDSVRTDPPPRAGLAAFDDSAIVFDVRFWHGPGDDDEFDARDEVIEAIDHAFKANAIAIPFPQRDVWMRDAAATETSPSIDGDEVGDHE